MGPISTVSVVSTGTVRIRPQHVDSTGSPLIWWLLTSRRWTAPRPINVYVIEHEQGLVLFDTGQDRDSVTDPHYFPTGLTGHLYARLARFAIRPAETLTERLREIGYEPSQVRRVVLSHLHQDHIGGLAELGNEEILVSEREWAGLDKACAEVKGLLEQHIKLPGLRWPLLTLPPVDDPGVVHRRQRHVGPPQPGKLDVLLEQALHLRARLVEPCPLPLTDQDLRIAQLGKAPDVILVKMGEHDLAHLAWLVTDLAQAFGQRLCRTDRESCQPGVEMAGETRREIVRIGHRVPILPGVEQH